jgi:hypothetical protein
MRDNFSHTDLAAQPKPRVLFRSSLPFLVLERNGVTQVHELRRVPGPSWAEGVKTAADYVLALLVNSDGLRQDALAALQDILERLHQTRARLGEGAGRREIDPLLDDLVRDVSSTVKALDP